MTLKRLWSSLRRRVHIHEIDKENPFLRGDRPNLAQRLVRVVHRARVRIPEHTPRQTALRSFTFPLSRGDFNTLNKTTDT